MFNNPEPKKELGDTTQFLYPICTTIRLEIPLTFPSTRFLEVVKNRKSGRDFSGVSIEQIGKVLWVACKVKDIAIDSSGYILTHRPSASAGARHPIDVLVVSPTFEDTAMYYYNPFEHTLNKLSLNEGQIDELKAHINTAVQLNNATIIWFLAHPSRTTAKYENASSLIWRDAGALIHSIQLACAYYNINSCALGTLGEPYISTLFSAIGEVWSAGGIAIG